MSFPPQNTPKSMSAGANPTWELTALPYPPQPVKRGLFAHEGIEWEGREELEGEVERKERGGKGGRGGAGVKNDGEERHGCWVIDAPGGGRLSGHHFSSRPQRRRRV